MILKADIQLVSQKQIGQFREIPNDGLCLSDIYRELIMFDEISKSLRGAKGSLGFVVEDHARASLQADNYFIKVYSLRI